MMTASARMRAEESNTITCGWGKEGQRKGKGDREGRRKGERRKGRKREGENGKELYVCVHVCVYAFLYA